LLIEASLDVARQHPGEIYPPYMALMVGDRAEDEECARIAGIDFTPAVDWRAMAEKPA
jgi:phosphoglycolate phosphatase-like HAD superfamily hydrolase